MRLLYILSERHMWRPAFNIHTLQFLNWKCVHCAADAGKTPESTTAFGTCKGR